MRIVTLGKIATGVHLYTVHMYTVHLYTVRMYTTPLMGGSRPAAHPPNGGSVPPLYRCTLVGEPPLLQLACTFDNDAPQ